MAGVFGIFDPTGKTRPEETADRLEGVLRFSAREKAGRWCGARAALGVIHLGLLHADTQPVFDEESGFRLVLDGEIDEPETVVARLRSAGAPLGPNPTEPELFLRLFLAEGPEGFRDVGGSWAFAALNEKAGEVVLATDRFGTRQIAWTLLPGGGIAFFPEIKGVLAFDAVSKEPDPLGVADLIAFQYLFGSRTLLRGVEVLPQATILRFRNGEARKSGYWTIPFPDFYPIVEEREWIDEYVRRMRRAVEKRFRKAPLAGTTLSGGRDTRLIAGAAPKDLPELHTFTFGVPGCHDRRFARKISRILGSVHHDRDLDAGTVLGNLDRYIWFTDGMVNARHGHISVLFPLIRDHVDVLLEGAPPASCFFYAFGIPGHNILGPVREEVFLDCFLAHRMEVKPEETAGVLAGPFAAAFREGPRESVRSALAGGTPAFEAFRSIRIGILHRFPRFTFAGARYMRLVMEVRQPFCDYELFDHAVTMPGSLFTDRGVYDRLIKNHFPELAGVPHHSTGLPAEPSLSQLFWRWRAERGRRWIARATGGRIRFGTRRRTFVYADWLRGPFRERVLRDLQAPHLSALGVVDPAAVRRLAEEHYGGGADRAAFLWPLLTLENWARQFFGGERPDPFDY